jgi:regulatory protein YycI of two-component signal transduction system YycFG
MPTAERGKEIKLYNATDLNTAAATILKENKKKALVVGHSNTVLEMIEALGDQSSIIQDYDYLFYSLYLQAENKVKVMHYGQPIPIKKEHK